MRRGQSAKGGYHAAEVRSRRARSRSRGTSGSEWPFPRSRAGEKGLRLNSQGGQVCLSNHGHRRRRVRRQSRRGWRRRQSSGGQVGTWCKLCSGCASGIISELQLPYSYGAAMPSRSSSSSWMMMRGVTIIMRLLVSRPMETFLKSRLMYGTFERSGTPNSLRPSLSRLMPPRSTVPPSGTLTVVTTDTNENAGNWTVTPLEFFASLLSFFSFLPSSSLSVVLDEFVLDEEPSNVNVST